jgi:FKBP-type peptidyl-prolyl cis-trans isomerase
MKRYSFLMMALPLVFAAGCTGRTNAPAEPATTTAPTAGGGELPKLETKDLVKGKVPEMRPKMKPVEAGDTVMVLYRGTYKDGTEFDSNMTADFKPKDKTALAFRVGDGSVIKAWDDGGFNGMYPGGRRRISVPWKLGYGETGNSKIPPRTDLYFDVELKEVIKSGENNTYYALDRKIGTGKEVKKGSKIVIDYVITDMWGMVLENTIDIKRPVDFTVDNSEVKEVIDDAVLGMRVGGQRDLWVPPNAGFRPPNDRAAAATSYIMNVYLRSVN